MFKAHIKWTVLVALVVMAASLLVMTSSADHGAVAAPQPQEVTADGQYRVLAWNDLGMHCYNSDFTDLAVLPPFNTLWAQVVKVGDPPQIITSGVTVTYVFTDNTFSVGKSNFWDVNPHAQIQNAQKLFGLAEPLPDNIGLTGKGLAGAMDLSGDHFVAEGIPLTEFRDSAPTQPYPYQLATIVVQDATTGAELARTITVAPVSTEMHCDQCHSDNGEGNEDIATGKVETNILTQHDRENSDEYPSGHTGLLMNRRPVLCAECHSSNALGAPGAGDVPSLSNAMHDKHAEVSPDSLAGCYNCHPGPQTQCLRDVMSQRGMTCVSCHGGMDNVARNHNPWLNEPRCDNAACHGSGYQQDQPLYRMSQEHGGLRCEACHDSTHAIAPSREPNDAIKFMAWQGHPGALNTCSVCHASTPTQAGPHGLLAPVQRAFSLTPGHLSLQLPGAQVLYTHTLHNTGNISDTYDLAWSSSQGWAVLTGAVAGGATLELPGPVTLEANQSALITVTVTIPNTTAVLGLTDTTAVTATSVLSPTLARRVTDTTIVPLVFHSLYLPVVLGDSGD